MSHYPPPNTHTHTHSNLYIKVNNVSLPTLNTLLPYTCSNGIGRTGVFITLHAQLERLKIEGVVDLFQFIKFARKQREGLVSSPVSH